MIFPVKEAAPDEVVDLSQTKLLWMKRLMCVPFQKPEG
jgi:hypothetical protein